MTTPKATAADPASQQPVNLVTAWVRSSKNAFAPLREFSGIANRAFAKANELTLAAATQYFDLNLRGLKLLGKMNDPNTLLEQQVALVKDASAQFFANAEAYAKLTAETQQEVRAWAKKSTQTAAAKVEAVVPKAA